jgi:hypothetical protein
MPLPPSFRKSHLSSQVQRSKGYSSHIESWDFAHDRRVEHEEFHLNPDEFPQENPGGKWMNVVHLFFSRVPPEAWFFMMGKKGVE